MKAIAKYIIFICILCAASYAAANYDISDLLKSRSKAAAKPSARDKFNFNAQIAMKASSILSGLPGQACLDYSPEKDLTVAGAEDAISFWRLPDQNPVREINFGDGFQAITVRFIPGSNIVAVGGKTSEEAGSIRLINTVTGEMTQQIAEPEPIMFIAPHQNGKFILATGQTYIKVIDLKDGNTVALVKKNSAEARGYYYGYEQHQYLLQSDTLSLFDFRTRTVPGVLDSKTTPAIFKESMDGKRFAWLSDAGVTLAATATGKKEFFPLQTKGFDAFDIHPDGKWGLFLIEEQKIAVIDLASARQLKTVALPTPLSDITFNSDGSSAYLLYTSGEIEVYDIGYRNSLKNIRYNLTRIVQNMKDKFAKTPAAKSGQ